MAGTSNGMEQATARHSNGSGADAEKPVHAPSEDGPTRPVDYAALNALWMTLAAGIVVSTRRRARQEPIELSELISMSAATFALSKAVARERIGSWVREPFVDEEHGRTPRGRRLRRAVGELVTCTRCVGTWSALGVVGLRVANPQAGRTVNTILAASAANDWMQAGFKYLCEATNSLDSR